MQTGRLLLLILLALVVVGVVVMVMRRSSAKREEQRVEAADLRGRAEGIAATMGGQQTFAQQAEERAAVARAEAEERAREAAALEEEAAQQRAAAEATRREYETTMRRADDVDPDVKESSFAPVRQDDEEGRSSAGAAAPVSAAAGAAALAAHDDDSTGRDSDADRRDVDSSGRDHLEGHDRVDHAAPTVSGDDSPMTRAERRLAREQAESEGGGTEHSDGAHVANAYGERDDVPTARGVGRDHETAAEDGPSRGVFGTAAAGTFGSMSDDTRERDQDQSTDDVSRDAESPRGEWGGPRSDDQPGDAAASASAGGERNERAERDELSTTDDEARRDSSSAEAGDLPTIIDDIEEFASTEPLLIEDQTPPVTRDKAGDDGAEHGDHDRDRSDDGRDEDVAGSRDERSSTDDETSLRDTSGRTDVTPDDEHATAETGARVATTEDDTAGSQDRFDSTPSRDWAADEGELLEENRARGDRLEEGRTQFGSTDDAGSSSTGQAARRVSEFHELRDGGYGVGSAATLDDGAQPLDHPVAGYRDSMTFRSSGDDGYDDTDPDVWFYDEAAAERNGFRRA